MFTLISLPYAPNALEPVISAQTLSFHHGKHLQGYVNNLNAMVPATPFEGLSLEEIVRKADGAVFNNAGQVLNHNLYFGQFKTHDQVGGDGKVTSPGMTGEDNVPTGPLGAQIVRQWGSLEAFQKEFETKGVGLFGSGWVWLSATPDGTLVITQEAGAHNPVENGLKPLLTFDVWEHAYYLDYQNRRADHIHALWQIVNWEEIDRRYAL